MADKTEAEGNGASAADTTTTHEDGLIDFPFKLESQCLLLPHYADCSKVGYVLEGRAVVGVILPGETKERAVLIKKGDVITVPKETYTWWYNDGDTDFSIIYLGDGAAGLTQGLFTYFLVAGQAAVYNGISTDFLAKACGVSQEAAAKFFSSQPGIQIIKPEKKLCVKTHDRDRHGIVLHEDSARFSNNVPCGGHVVSMTKDNLAALEGRFRFSINITKLEPNAMRVPGFSPAIQLVYITRGSGQVQISGVNGATIMDKEVAAGCVFVVQKFYVMAAVAGSEGLEWFSIITSERPIFHPVVGKTSPLSLTNADVLEISLGVTSDLLKLVRAHGGSHDVIVAAPK